MVENEIQAHEEEAKGVVATGLFQMFVPAEYGLDM
jgi:hypothetical protein